MTAQTNSYPLDSFSPDLRRLVEAVPAVAGEPAGEDVSFTAGDVDFAGWIARPTAAPDGVLPAVLVIHDWLGMRDVVAARAQMLARLGYVAFGADIYGADVRPSPEEAGGVAGSFYGDTELFRERLFANLERLRAEPGVDPERIAVIGYCFGGSGALELVRAGADVAGAVSFHGNLSTSAPAAPGAVTAPVLVLTGAADPMVTDEQVVAFADEMRDAGAPDWQIVAYSGAMHAFTVPDANSPEHGAAYDATADRRSWIAMSSFLEESFA